MKQLIVSMAALAFAGCLSIKVEDLGYEALRDADGKILVDSEGKAQTIHRGQRWKYSKHWYEQVAEEFEFSRRPGDDISLRAKNYRDAVSAELNKLVDTSFKGATELTAKIAAAIVTSGGSVAGEGAYSAVKNMVAKFVGKGGNASKATVTCSDGSCTVTDGTITETCADCYTCTDGGCSPTK